MQCNTNGYFCYLTSVNL